VIKALGDETLRTIVRELIAAVGKNLTIDWTVWEHVRAQFRVIVKPILHKYRAIHLISRNERLRLFRIGALLC
jgi:hypothetical protein